MGRYTEQIKELEAGLSQDDVDVTKYLATLTTEGKISLAEGVELAFSMATLDEIKEYVRDKEGNTDD